MDYSFLRLFQAALTIQLFRVTHFYVDLGKLVKVWEGLEGQYLKVLYAAYPIPPIPPSFSTVSCIPPCLTVMMTICPLKTSLENNKLCSEFFKKRGQNLLSFKLFFDQWRLKLTPHKMFLPHCKRVQGSLQLIYYLLYNFFLLFWCMELPHSCQSGAGSFQKKKKILQFKKKLSFYFIF